MALGQAQLIGRPRSNGCAYADSPTAFPIQRMPNISLQPGAEDVSLADLIAGVDRGIFISGAGSWSIDQQRDNFQFGGQLFWEIQNGKLGPMLRDVAYQARTVPFWNSLDGLGGKSTYELHGAFTCGKAQPIANRAGRAWRGACALPGRHHPQHGAEGYLTMMLSPDEVKAIASKIIARSGAEACTVSVSGGDSRNFRFARNEAHHERRGQQRQRLHRIELRQADRQRHRELARRGARWNRRGCARRRSRGCRRRTRNTCRRSGPRPTSPRARATMRHGLHPGVWPRPCGSSAIAAGRNRAGHCRLHRGRVWLPRASPQRGAVRLRPRDSAETDCHGARRRNAWSGWAGASQNRFSALDPAGLGERAVSKALFPGDAADLDPGTYT